MLETISQKGIEMKKALMTVCAVCALVLGVGLSRQAPVAPARAAAADVSRVPAAQPADQLQLDTPDRADCEQNATSDAASCATGGWVFDAGADCCLLGPGRIVGRWRKGSQVKCCGGCTHFP